ncbi:hypothetical protein B0I35DRAFT_472520 [Stachybotrys elegans]|uniref:Uncharacterized protein n=1 Tax=Stachybotrys elegans TaxID=80388 RepID=A0A8K0WW28_9HYPO|nr:hypothetical protein B0I35DRAFT_472520 [Stachybotrys elegans]
MASKETTTTDQGLKTTRQTRTAKKAADNAKTLSAQGDEVPGAEKPEPRPQKAHKDASEQSWKERLKQVKKLNGVVLHFLASIVRQNSVPLSSGLTFRALDSSSRKSSFVGNPGDHASKDTPASTDWLRARRELDRTFRALVTWQNDIVVDEVEPDDDLVHAEDVDCTMVSLFTLAHCLTHLLDLESPEWEKIEGDAEIHTVAEAFKKKIDNLGKTTSSKNTSAHARCPICNGGSEPTEKDKPKVEDFEYLVHLKMLVSSFKKDSEPLQLALRRMDWARQSAKYRDERDREDPDVPRKKPKGENV